MAVSYKVLGQLAPSADTNSTLYTVPANTQAIISTLNICNQGNTDATFKIAVRPSGQSLDPRHYIAFGTTVASSDAISLTIGMTLAASDVVTVNANTGNLSFTAFGSEIV